MRGVRPTRGYANERPTPVSASRSEAQEVAECRFSRAGTRRASLESASPAPGSCFLRGDDHRLHLNTAPRWSRGTRSENRLVQRASAIAHRPRRLDLPRFGKALPAYADWGASLVLLDANCEPELSLSFAA